MDNDTQDSNTIVPATRNEGVGGPWPAHVAISLTSMPIIEQTTGSWYNDHNGSLSIKSYLPEEGQVEISTPVPPPVSTKITSKKGNLSQGLIRDPQFQRLKDYMRVPVLSPFTSEDFSSQKSDRSGPIIEDCH